jgi:hypothetical protein
MRPARRYRFLMGVRRWRDAAQVLALLALLANATLLPSLHFAAGGRDPISHAVHDAQPVPGRQNPDDGGGREPTGPSHQVCHFCRLLGAALPPPPVAVIERVSADRTAHWSRPDPQNRRQAPVRSANRPRAPPLRA